jgi:hypothetical protein
MVHLLMENRYGLIVDALVSEATGTAERDGALTMMVRQGGRQRVSLGTDKPYDVAGFVTDLRAPCTSPPTSPRTLRAAAR